MQVSDRIGRRVKLHDLHVLLAVAQAGSMSKAAALLNTGQPAISRSIADLEHAFGVRLLDRDRRGVMPTAYGRALLEGGIAVFDDLQQAVKNIEFLADPTVGTVRVGCTPSLAATFISAVVDRLSQRYPRIVFRLMTATTAHADTLHDELMDRNVDLVITHRSGPMTDERLHYELLFEDTFSIVVGARNPLARRRKIGLIDLTDQRWVLPPSHSVIASIAREAFRAGGFDYPNATVITEPAQVRLSLLATGQFVSIFSNAILKFSAQRHQLKVLPVKQILKQVPVGILTLKNRTPSPLTKLFVAESHQVAKGLVENELCAM